MEGALDIAALKTVERGYIKVQGQSTYSATQHVAISVLQKVIICCSHSLMHGTLTGVAVKKTLGLHSIAVEVKPTALFTIMSLSVQTFNSSRLTINNIYLFIRKDTPTKLYPSYPLLRRMT